MTTRTEGIECKTCGKMNDAHAPADGGDAVPEDGSLSICFYCGVLTTFSITEDGMKLVPLTEQEEKEAMEHPDVRRALAMIRRRQMQE